MEGERAQVTYLPEVYHFYQKSSEQDAIVEQRFEVKSSKSPSPHIAPSFAFLPSRPIDFHLFSREYDYAILPDGQGRIVIFLPLFVGPSLRYPTDVSLSDVNNP